MSAAPPSKSLLPQQFYWDTSVQPGRIWAGVPLTEDPNGLDLVLDTGAAVVAMTGTAPPGNVPAPLWWDSNSGQLFVRYDDGSSVQWVSANSIDASTLEGSFLPLSGGTVTSHLTGTAMDAALDIVSTAVGSGVNGPVTSQIGLNIDHQKVGWYAGTSAIGEIDGLNIQVRQGGAGSDAGGMLVNVVGTGNGFLAITEAVVQQQTAGTGATLFSIRTQEGGMSPTTGERFGKLLIADHGNMSAAIQTQNTPSVGYWGYVLKNAKDNVQNFSLDDSGNIVTSGVITSAGTHGTAYLRSDDAVSVLYSGAGIQFNIGGATAEVLGSGQFQIFGTTVVGTRKTGWGVASGGSRVAFNAGTATLPQTSAALAALIFDLTAHGLIGT